MGIKKAIGLRVSPEDEVDGLDIAEMGMEAYPDAIEMETRSQEEVRIRPPGHQPPQGMMNGAHVETPAPTMTSCASVRARASSPVLRATL